MSPEEKALRKIFEYLGIDKNEAKNATLRTYLEEYKRNN